MAVEDEVSAFIDKFAPSMQDLIRSCRSQMERLLPQAVQLVYDNYNFFVIGFSPTPKPSKAVFSLAADRHGISLCFLQDGPQLPDPDHLLRGSGKKVRNLPLPSADELRRPAVQQLIDAALERAGETMEGAEGPRVIVQSVSDKRRPRR